MLLVEWRRPSILDQMADTSERFRHRLNIAQNKLTLLFGLLKHHSKIHYANALRLFIEGVKVEPGSVTTRCTKTTDSKPMLRQV